jgi:hypothetical protein
MTLTIKERLLLLSVLPEKGDIVSIRIVRQLRESLSFSEEDHARLGIKSADGIVQWDDKVPQDTEVEIGPKAHLLIAEALNKLSESKALTEDFISLWDKFSPTA